MKRKRNLSVLGIVAIAIIGLLAFVYPLEKAYADEDTTAPELVSFSFNKQTINTEAGSDTLTLTLELSDDLTGVDVSEVEEDVFVTQATQVSVVPVSGGSQSAVFIGFEMTNGTATSGTFVATITLPQGSAIGEWRVDMVWLHDQVGNVVVYGYEQLLEHAAIEDATDLAFTNEASTEDTTAPVVLEIEFSAETIDTSEGSDQVDISVTLTDDIIGVTDYGVGVNLVPQSGGGQAVFVSGFTLSEGTATNGVFTATATFPQYSANGVWVVDNVSVTDALGNMRSYLEEDLDDIEGTKSITNTADIEDVDAPELTYFRITPVEFDTSEEEVELKLEIGLTDEYAGIHQDTQVRIQPLISTQTRDFIELEIDEDHELDNVYKSYVTLPQYSKQGIWIVEQVLLYDTLGNSRTIFSSELSELFPEAEGLVLVNKALSDEVTIETEWMMQNSTVRVTFPEGTVVTRSDEGVFALYRMLSQGYDLEELDGFQGFIDAATSDTNDDLEACDESEACVSSELNDENLSGQPIYALRMGIPGLSLSFSEPVTITVRVPESLLGQTLLIQTFAEGGDSWFDQATCTVAMFNPHQGEGEGSGGGGEGEYPACSFTTSHASFFTANVLGSNSNGNAGVPNTGLGGSEQNWFTKFGAWVNGLFTN